MKQREKIKKIRQFRGLTQKEVAQKMGVSVQCYSQYETGKRTPTRKTLDKIAEALGCESSEIADDLVSRDAQNTHVTDDTTTSGIDMLFRDLNTNGQRKAIEYITMLLNEPRYSIWRRPLHIRFKKLAPTAKAPTQGSTWAAGYDLYADTSKDILIKPGETVVIKTNIAMEIPAGYFGAVESRSGLSTKRGLRVAQGTGIIDSDYRGGVCVPLHNDSQITQRVTLNERVAQLIVQPCERVQWAEVPELSDTDRGSGGFGSTGR